MNDLLIAVTDAGYGQLIYDIFFALGFVSVLSGLIWFGRKLEIALSKTVITVLIVYPLVVLWMFVMYWMESGFTSWGGNNIVRIFVYVPVVGIPTAWLLKVEKKKMLSLLSFGPLLVHGISHFGCIFTGCCCGYPWEYGIYTPGSQDYRFPIQPIEALGAVAIVAYLFHRAKKRNYVPDGMEYPLMLTLYGSSRFLFEFCRDGEKLIWGISSLAFHALFMFVVGLIWIWRIKKEKTTAV